MESAALELLGDASQGASGNEPELQLRAVHALLADGVDQTYLDRWADELSVKDLLKRARDAGHER